MTSPFISYLPYETSEFQMRVKMLKLIHRAFDLLSPSQQEEYNDLLVYSLQTLERMDGSLRKLQEYDHIIPISHVAKPGQVQYANLLIQASDNLEREWRLMKRDFVVLIDNWRTIFRETGLGELDDWIGATFHNAFHFVKKEFSGLRTRLKVIAKNFSLRFGRRPDQREEHKKKHQVVFKQVDDEDHN